MVVNDEVDGFLGGYMSAEERRHDHAVAPDGASSTACVLAMSSSGYYGRRLTLHLMVQPAVAKISLLADPLAREQGFLARCTQASRNPPPGSAAATETDIAQTLAYRAYTQRMADAADRCCSRKEAVMPPSGYARSTLMIITS